ncbi:MAG TPA: hypothetical protein VGB79_04995 [Allosphingosinicella sp.]|jgi:hypothetical protein
MQKHHLNWKKASVLRDKKYQRFSDKGLSAATPASRVLPYFQMAGSAATVVAILVSLWATNTLADAQKLRSELQLSHRERLEANQGASAARQRAQLFQAESRTASARVAELRQQEERLASELLLVEADLRARTQDVSAARTELLHLRNRASSIESALAQTRQSLVRVTVTAFVMTHLEGARRQLLAMQASHTMLFDPAHSDFANAGFGRQFLVEARRLDDEDPTSCRLSERFMMRGGGVPGESDVRTDQIMGALCEYLRGSAHFTDLDDWVRATVSGRDAPALRRWEALGNDGPFEIMMLPGSNATDSHEDERIRSFWIFLDAAGARSVPGTEGLLGEEDSQPNSDTGLLASELSRFWRGWPAFAATLRTNAHHELWEIRGREIPPPLWPVERVTRESLRSGRVFTTRRFDFSLLCAAAWYAYEQHVISPFARDSYCATN